MIEKCPVHGIPTRECQGRRDVWQALNVPSRAGGLRMLADVLIRRHRELISDDEMCILMAGLESDDELAPLLEVFARVLALESQIDEIWAAAAESGLLSRAPAIPGSPRWFDEQWRGIARSTE